MSTTGISETEFWQLTNGLHPDQDRRLEHTRPVIELPAHVREPQRATVEWLRRRCAGDPRIEALVVIGSTARGEALAGSDVDCAIVLDREDREQRAQRGELGMHGAAADGRVEFGGEFTDMDVLRLTAQRGPEPARFAFTKAIVAFSRIPDLASVLSRIPVYPEAEREEKMKSFVSQLPVHLAYLKHAVYAKKEWLLAQTAVELVLFGGRLILAENRILFPNRKHFIASLERAPRKPDGLVDLARELSAHPSIALAQRFHDSVMSFADWPVPPEGHWARFSKDRETNWRTSRPALADS